MKRERLDTWTIISVLIATIVLVVAEVGTFILTAAWVGGELYRIVVALIIEALWTAIWMIVCVNLLADEAGMAQQRAQKERAERVAQRSQVYL
jgi:hypothetical protein